MSSRESHCMSQFSLSKTAYLLGAERKIQYEENQNSLKIIYLLCELEAIGVDLKFLYKALKKDLTGCRCNST